MQSQIWREAIENSADAKRAAEALAQLKKLGSAAPLKKIIPEQARILAALLSGSQFLTEQLLTNPDWLAPLLTPDFLQYPRHEQGLRREIDTFLHPLLRARDYPTALSMLRRFKQREMLRIAARDLAHLAGTLEITQEISDVADVCLDSVFEICWQQLTERFGKPYSSDAEDRWQETKFAVIGLGKLGGQELNYSSDVDVIFVYSDEGNVFKTPPRKFDQSGKGLTNHQFFTRLAESFIAEVARLTSDGALFRIDLRLRPEGDAGPLVRSLESYENFYAQWGQTWERMMLIKARPVAGDQQLAAEFLETIQSFRYPRSIGERTLRDIDAMKQRIENEVVKAGEIDRDVKRGRGGIREIEFVVQSLQLLHAGRQPFLQSAQTIPTVQKLVHYELLLPADADELREAYLFLRDLEHRLQMEANQQTHTVPTERRARERLAKLMHAASLAEFEKTWRKHTQNVRLIYEKILKNDEPSSASGLPDDFSGNEDIWKKLLAEHSFRDAEQAFRMVQIFVSGPGYVHVSPRTAELARDLLPKFFALCPKKSQSAGGFAPGTVGQAARLSGPNPAINPANNQGVGPTPRTGEPPVLQTQHDSNCCEPVASRRSVSHPPLSDPDRVLVRLDSFVSSYGARASLYELWTRNPALFELLLLLFDRSEFLAELAIRTPDLVDELEVSGRLRRHKTADEILKDLRYGMEDEDQKLWLRRYHQAELMRIGLRDILGLTDFEQNLLELSALADACLRYALESVSKKLKFKADPLCIIGLGKLGGQEINYGSDLDIIFVAGRGEKKLPQLQRLAAEVMDLLSTKTEAGAVFQVDARLRPDGEKGLLVTTLDAYEDYYRRRAQLWEIQALTRIRPIAGDLSLGGQFQKLAAAITNFQKPSLPLTAYKPDWKKEVVKMRERIEKERTPAGKNPIAIKTGTGGLMDAEFLAQTLCLENGWTEANTLKALQRACKSGALMPDDGKILVENYRALLCIECILRRWSFEGEVLLPDDPSPMYRVAVRCGFNSADEFMGAVDEYRRNIRTIYQKKLACPST